MTCIKRALLISRLDGLSSFRASTDQIDLNVYLLGDRKVKAKLKESRQCVVSQNCMCNEFGNGQ